MFGSILVTKLITPLCSPPPPLPDCVKVLILIRKTWLSVIQRVNNSTATAHLTLLPSYDTLFWSVETDCALKQTRPCMLFLRKMLDGQKEVKMLLYPFLTFIFSTSIFFDKIIENGGKCGSVNLWK